MWVAVVLIVALAVPPAPFSPPQETIMGADDCITGPLQLRATDYFTMGQVANRITTQGCSRLIGNAERPPHFGNYVIGRTRFGRFNLLGEELGWGINVVTQPGTRIGEPDLMYATPALDLPEKWQRRIDQATVPVIAVGGAVILTSVLLGVLKKK
jgi:hypothetical protein